MGQATPWPAQPAPVPPFTTATRKQKATADDVAEFLAPYVDAGSAEFNLIPQSPDDDQAVAGVAAVKKLLARP